MMQEINKLDRLKNFGNIADSLKDKVMPDTYWENEEKLLKERIEENRRVSESIKMSRDKFQTHFTI